MSMHVFKPFRVELFEDDENMISLREFDFFFSLMIFFGIRFYEIF